MPERVTARVLGDAGLAQRALDGALNDGFVQVMAAPLAGEAIHIVSGRREHPLPAELASAFGYFRASASGRATQPAPVSTSTRCCRRTASTCASRRVLAAVG